MRLIKFLSIIIAILVMSNITLANQSLDQSLKMSSIAADVESLTKENAILRAQIAHSGALATIESKIHSAGFVPPTQIVSVGNTSATVASSR